MPMHAEHNNDDTIITIGDSSLEKYTSHFFLKGFERVTKGIIVWEVSWRLNRTATYWPPNSSGYHSLSFPFSCAAQPGAWGPSFCWDMVLIPASTPQLIWTSCRQGNIIIWRPPTSCERHSSHLIQSLDSQGHPWSPDIFDRMHLVHFFFWQIGRVGGQYETI